MLERLDPRSSDTREPGPSDPREADARDPRDAFASGLDLPRGHDRERVYVLEHDYELRGSETRALATIGTFRVVPASDLRDDGGRAGDLRHGDLERLSTAGLIRRVAPVEGDRRTALVALTERGRELLEHHRTHDHASPQRFYAGPSKARELTHDLPMLDDGVQFPDLRIEYEWPDGRREIENVEVLTPHYRGAHAAAKAASGFTCYRGAGARVGGSGNSAQGGRPFDPDLADEFLR